MLFRSPASWLLVDANDMVLGRLSSQVAALLRGKHKPNFTPNTLCGDKVIIINSAKVKLTGNKWKDKMTITHSGYPGGQKAVSAEKIREKNPNRLIEDAVRRMLPKNKLGSRMFANMFVYAGDKHDHDAQNPISTQLTL